MTKSSCLLLVIGFIFSCSERSDKSASVYDTKNYKKVLPIGKDTSLQEGYDVFINIFDTSRKMLKYYWNNGNIQAISFFYKNKRDGKWLGYFENGSKSFEENYVNGLKDDTQKIYHSNGRVFGYEIYNQGVKRGTWRYYDTSGNLIRTKAY
jgi:hypothetical protein